MSVTLSRENFGDKLYQSLPAVYRNEDENVKLALKRYLQACGEGGFSYIIDENNKLLELIDPDLTPTEVLPILFEQYGLTIFHGLPESFVRKLLPVLSDLYKRKGTLEVVEYITSTVSGIKADVVVSTDFLTDFLVMIRLEMDYEGNTSTEFPDIDQLLRIIKEFVPFYCDAHIVLVYMYNDEADLIGDDEDFYDKLYITTDETISLNQRSVGNSSLSIEDVHLSDNLILSMGEIAGDNQSWDVIIAYTEKATINSTEESRTNEHWSVTNHSMVSNSLESFDHIIVTK